MKHISAHFFSLMLFFLSCLIIVPHAQAITLLTEKEALRYVFQDADSIIPVKKIVTEEQFKRIIRQMGGKIVLHAEGKRAQDIINRREYTFYLGLKGQDKLGCALILEEPGRWGPITVMVSLNTGGTIKDVLIMGYSETRGRSVSRESFLRQFAGKTARDPLTLHKDVRAITGATISSEAVTFTVKKAVLLYKELFLKD